MIHANCAIHTGEQRMDKVRVKFYCMPSLWQAYEGTQSWFKETVTTAVKSMKHCLAKKRCRFIVSVMLLSGWVSMCPISHCCCRHGSVVSCKDLSQSQLFSGCHSGLNCKNAELLRWSTYGCLQSWVGSFIDHPTFHKIFPIRMSVGLLVHCM